MAEYADGLFAIEVDTDDYAKTAAGDTPSVPRTFQSEADFQTQKSSYAAKVDVGDNYHQLLKAVPLLGQDGQPNLEDGEATAGTAQPKLSKKDLQLLGYAVGELYYDKEYAKIIELCSQVADVCQVDAKTLGSLRKWAGRCEGRVRRSDGRGS
ncbi:hypothetical protein LTR85_011626 [Meristemomyces frigidus]|nr:hypothetical protein LTR85_011626 [Meristemomyces frigidus]